MPQEKTIRTSFALVVYVRFCTNLCAYPFLTLEEIEKIGI